MQKTLLLFVVLALASGVGPVRVQPAAAAQTVRFSILPQKHFLIGAGAYSAHTMGFMYPIDWMLTTNPPGLYGMAPPNLIHTGWWVSVTPEARGTTHDQSVESPGPGWQRMEIAPGGAFR